MKRFIHTIRNKILVISQIIIPIACLLINLIYLKYAPIKPEDSPALLIDINRYSKNSVPITRPKNVSNPMIDDLYKIYGLTVNGSRSAKAYDLENNQTFNLCLDHRRDIDDYIGCMGQLSLGYIVDDYLIGTDFTLNRLKHLQIVGLFNNQPYHIPPLAVNLISNTLLKYYTNLDSKITVINHPLPRNLKEKLNDLIGPKDMAGFNVASGLTFGFSFLIASFAVFLIKEKSSDSKHLQYLSGCNSYTFWTSALIWDVFNYMVSIALVPILLKVVLILFLNYEKPSIK